MSDWADIKAETRKAVHAAFAISASYVGPTSFDVSQNLRVRWHPAGSRIGDLVGASGYAEIVTAADRVIFDRDELAARAIVPARGGLVTLTVAGESVDLRLDTKVEYDGPVTEIWQVTRE